MNSKLNIAKKKLEYLFWKRLSNKRASRIRDEIERIYDSSDNMFRLANLDFFYEIIVGEKIDEKLKKTYERFITKYGIAIELPFLKIYGNICTDEQLYRITEYFGSSLYFLNLIEYTQNKLIYKTIAYILQNDYNWIISLNKILDNIGRYSWLISDTKNISDTQINDEIILIFLEVISDNHNYFEINSYSDLVNFKNKKNAICLNILNGNLNEIPDKLKEMSSDDRLYKFALLEYKFGIDLGDAEVLVNRYGMDVEELPDGILKDYLQLLKEIVECDNIKEIITFANKNGMIKEPWTGFPSSREAEGKILDLFADLYNETLYKPRKEDKEENEIYIDSNGNKHEIEVYKIKEDFRMCVRSEGVFGDFDPNLCDEDGNIINYNEYYNQHSIENHGNSESYLGNENIAIANTEYISVGYVKINNNQLAGASPRLETNETNGMNTIGNGRHFSIYGAKNIELRTPNNLINNTRVIGNTPGHNGKVNFNEIYKDRFIVNENGEIEQYKPSYIVYIDESIEEERKNPKWKEKKEKQKKWLLTKQAAAELGVPIVIIDREYFAKREMQKVELMKQLIAGEQIDEEKYGRYLQNYQGLSKPAIIKRLFTTIENNKTGMINNLKFRKRFFTLNYCKNTRSTILNAIDKMNKKEALECLNALIEIAKKELSMKIHEGEASFYRNTIQLAKRKLKLLGESKDNSGNIKVDYERKIDLLKMYLKYGVSKDDLMSLQSNQQQETIRKGEVEDEQQEE